MVRNWGEKLLFTGYNILVINIKFISVKMNKFYRYNIVLVLNSTVLGSAKFVKGRSDVKCSYHRNKNNKIEHTNRI